MKKKIFAMLLSTCFCLLSFGMPSVFAQASDFGECGDKLTWSLDDKGVLTISGSGKMADYEMHSAPWFRLHGIKSVNIEENVTSVGEYAFFDLEIKRVTIPDSVTSIGKNAFGNCYMLKSIAISDNVTSIGGGAFSNCKNLTEITVGANNLNYCSDEGVLFDKEKTKLIQYPNGKTAEEYTVPDNVTALGENSFLNCDKLKKITFPADSLTAIEKNAFYGCRSLKGVKISENVNTIGEYAFYDCNGLSDITISEGVTSIGNGAFGNCRFVNIWIPESVTFIGENAFEGCDKLANIIIDGDNNPNYCSADGILYSKDKTKLICVPGGRPVDGRYEISNTVTSIGNYAFASCSLLKNITIPDRDCDTIGLNQKNL